MAENAKTRGGAFSQFSWLFMLLAVGLTAGFMVWLAVESEPTTVAVMEEPPAEEETVAPDAARLALSDLVNAAQYEGQAVVVENVPFVAGIAPQLHWTVLPNSNSYLIRLAPSLVEQGYGQVGQILTLTGTIRPLNDDVIAEWRQSGVITEDAQAAQIQGVPTYLDVTSIDGGASSAGGTPAGGN